MVLLKATLEEYHCKRYANVRIYVYHVADTHKLFNIDLPISVTIFTSFIRLLL